MNFRRSISGRRGLFKAGGAITNILDESYPSDLQLYKVPPVFEISFKEFEECTAERLLVLQTIDEVNSRGTKGDDWHKEVVKQLREHSHLRGFCKLITSTGCGSKEADFVMRRRDHVSHFVLLLAYSDTEEKRRWFINREVDLFRFRWLHLNSAAKAEFLKANNFNFDQVSEEEKKELGVISCGMVSPSVQFFRVNFTKVSELVRQRRVFVHKGDAYITTEETISVVLNAFRTDLARTLAYASRRIHHLDEDERMVMVLKGASRMKRETSYQMDANKETVDIRQLDSLSERSFPPCMSLLHKRLRADHHLKYHGRLQYTLFLKGIGVALDDCIAFFRAEFTKKMEPEKFEKGGYMYGIRHSYGQEGKRANYSPHSCLKVISASPASGEHHGCPFKSHISAIASLCSGIEGKEVLDLAKSGNYQLACGRYFAMRHNGAQVQINHPNHYFDLSQAVAKGEAPSGVSALKNAAAGGENGAGEWGDLSGLDFSAVEAAAGQAS